MLNASLRVLLWGTLGPSPPPFPFDLVALASTVFRTMTSCYNLICMIMFFSAPRVLSGSVGPSPVPLGWFWVWLSVIGGLLDFGLDTLGLVGWVLS